MSELTVVIITYNEEENIGRCIDSVRDIAGEIIVVDSFSADGTKKIAEAKGARVVERKFTNYIEQKNFAMAQAANAYVLNLDADEFLSNELNKSITTEKSAGFKADAYSMNRLNFYCGKAIKTCGWYPDTKIRLWNREKGNWQGELIHEVLVMNDGASLRHLQGDIIHHSFPNEESLVLKVDKFARIAAQQLKLRAYPYLLFKMLFSAPFKFLRNYFFKLGFTDGIAGAIICYHQSREVFLKYRLAIQYKGGRIN